MDVAAPVWFPPDPERPPHCVANGTPRYALVRDRGDGNGYLAGVSYEHDGRDIHTEMRPSEAVFLAIRAKVPIYVDDQIGQNVLV